MILVMTGGLVYVGGGEMEGWMDRWMDGGMDIEMMVLQRRLSGRNERRDG